jgi:DNA-binding NtrC family response regulator
MYPKTAIVCVDDEAIILMALVSELKSHYGDSFIYEQALNADSALAAIDQLESEGIIVSLVITDWLMPGVKGDVFLEMVNKKYPLIKAIMITGQADEEAIDRMKRKEYVVSVLRKPWSYAELRSIITSSVR